MRYDRRHPIKVAYHARELRAERGEEAHFLKGEEPNMIHGQPYRWEEEGGHEKQQHMESARTGVKPRAEFAREGDEFKEQEGQHLNFKARKPLT